MVRGNIAVETTKQQAFGRFSFAQISQTQPENKGERMTWRTRMQPGIFSRGRLLLTVFAFGLVALCAGFVARVAQAQLTDETLLALSPIRAAL